MGFCLVKRTGILELVARVATVSIWVSLLNSSFALAQNYIGYAPSKLAHLIGVQKAGTTSWIVPAGPEGTGFMTYGPYVEAIPAGRHEVHFVLQVDNNTNDDLEIAYVDAFDANTGLTISSRTISRRQFLGSFRPQDFALSFQSAVNSKLEFRVVTRGNSYVEHNGTFLVMMTNSDLNQGQISAYNFENYQKFLGDGVKLPQTLLSKAGFSLSDEAFFAYAYYVLFSRHPEPEIVRSRAMLVPHHSRVSQWNDMVGALSSADPAGTKREFIRNLYRHLLHRLPGPAEVEAWAGRVMDHNLPGAANNWLEIFNEFGATLEFRLANKCDAVFSYGEAVHEQAPTLADLASGTAVFEDPFLSGVDLKYNRGFLRDPSKTTYPSEEARLQNESKFLGSLGTKFVSARTFDSFKGEEIYYFFMRGDRGLRFGSGGLFNIYLFESRDGINLSPVDPDYQTAGNEAIADIDTIREIFPPAYNTLPSVFLDPHISIDNTTCPPTYVLTTECVTSYGTSACVSTSQLPGEIETWKKPSVIVEGFNNISNFQAEPQLTNLPGYADKVSASTNVVLIDGTDKYVAWSEVNDKSVMPFPENANDNADGLGENTSTRALQISDLATTNGRINSPDVLNREKILLAADGVDALGRPCTAIPGSSWDCSYKDKQDWKKEGNSFFLIYNGMNYNRMVYPNDFPDYFKAPGGIISGVGIASSSRPMGKYENLPAYPNGPVLGPNTHVKDIGYPTLNVINGVVTLYYTFVPTVAGSVEYATQHCNDSDRMRALCDQGYFVNDIHARRSRLIWKDSTRNSFLSN